MTKELEMLSSLANQVCKADIEFPLSLTSTMLVTATF